MASMSQRKKTQTGIRVDPDLLERVKDAIWHIGMGLTLTNVAESALLAEVQRLEKLHNGGKRFAPRTGPLPKGK